MEIADHVPSSPYLHEPLLARSPTYMKHTALQQRKRRQSLFRRNTHQIADGGTLNALTVFAASAPSAHRPHIANTTENAATRRTRDHLASIMGNYEELCIIGHDNQPANELGTHSAALFEGMEVRVELKSGI